MEATTQPRRTIGERLRRNPVRMKELRGRMRGKRAFVVLTAYVILMSAFTSLLYISYTATTSLSVSSSGSVAGKIVFGGVVAIQFMLVSFIAPALTVGAISGERERQTFDLLRTTLLTARSFVMGKLGSAMSFILLLLVTAVPLQSLAFLLGGVTIAEVLLALLMLVVTATMYSTVGLFFSSLTKRTLLASVLTYGFVLASTFGLPLVVLVLAPILQAPFLDVTSPVVESIIIYSFGLLISINPVLTMLVSEGVLLEENSLLLFDYSLQSSPGTHIPLISPWLAFTILYALASLLLIALTTHKVRRVDT